MKKATNYNRESTASRLWHSFDTRVRNGATDPERVQFGTLRARASFAFCSVIGSDSTSFNENITTGHSRAREIADSICRFK
jgi:hypothetical protein